MLVKENGRRRCLMEVLVVAVVVCVGRDGEEVEEEEAERRGGERAESILL